MPARLQCPQCPTRVPLWDADLERGDAYCASCGTVFDASEQLDRPLPDYSTMLPRGMKVLRHEPRDESIGDPYRQAAPEPQLGRLELRRRGMFGDSTRNEALGVLVLGGIVVGLNVALGNFDGFPPWVTWLSLTALAGAAALLAFDRLNHTSIRFDATMLTVVRGPIAPRRDVSIETLRIEGLRCVLIESPHVERNGEPGPPTFEVEVFVRGSEPVRLVKGLRHPSHALAIAGMLEQHRQRGAQA